MMKIFLFAVVLFCSVVSVPSEAQTIIRRVGPGGANQNDLVDIPEIASMIMAKEGSLVVDNVFDMKLRTKGNEEVDVRQGDVILMINGKRVKTAKALKSEYESSTAGSQVKLGIQRKESMMIVSFVKADASKLPKRQVVMMDGGEGGSMDMLILPNTGIVVASGGKKITIDKIMPGEPGLSKEADVREGDVVTAINGAPAGRFKDFSAAFEKIAVGKKVTITTSRGGTAHSFSFTKEKGNDTNIIRREEKRP